VVIAKGDQVLLASVSLGRTRPYDLFLFFFSGALVIPTHVKLIEATFAALTTLFHDLVMVAVLGHIIVALAT